MDFAPARIYMEQAIAVSGSVKDRNDAELATIYANLGLIAQSQGEFEEADRAYARSEAIIRRTYGEADSRHWVSAANRARAAHLGGNRERAMALFATVFKNIPASSSLHDAVEAREWYAGCLAAEGRAAEAVADLENAERAYQSAHLFDFQLPRVRATLGDAYDRLGRVEDARRTLKAALDHRVANDPASFQPVLAIRERWGRFLLTQGEIDAAGAQFEEILKQSLGRNLAHVALAHGGLARVALTRGDVRAASAASAKALDTFGNVTGFRDVRIGPYLWLIHSEVLRQSGDLAGSLEWATRALRASRRHDHPSAASITAAETAIRAAGS
jgi:serine/threonine-protein kinase